MSFVYVYPAVMVSGNTGQAHMKAGRELELSPNTVKFVFVTPGRQSSKAASAPETSLAPARRQGEIDTQNRSQDHGVAITLRLKIIPIPRPPDPEF
uniref:hypothetical protein n=1 Tax=Pararhizobium sp. IMCC3301 TaxID=3067904 RepID=UPI0027425ECB|nr:hypothetical protein [Pararhizobium sp. IMCC3301]